METGVAFLEQAGLDMKKQFITTKFYYGFPVFILAYKDQQFGYNITTCSSSYSLGSMMVVGLFKGSHAARQISHFREFSLNLPTERLILAAEQAGFSSARDKLTATGLKNSRAERIDAPLLDDCPVSIECQVEHIQEFSNYINFTARIVNRWVEEDLLDWKGGFKNTGFQPIEYMGDGKARVYRYLAQDRADELGKFIKRKRKTDN